MFTRVSFMYRKSARVEGRWEGGIVQYMLIPVLSLKNPSPDVNSTWFWSFWVFLRILQELVRIRPRKAPCKPSTVPSFPSPLVSFISPFKGGEYYIMRTVHKIYVCVLLRKWESSHLSPFAVFYASDIVSLLFRGLSWGGDHVGKKNSWKTPSPSPVNGTENIGSRSELQRNWSWLFPKRTSDGHLDFSNGQNG